MPWPLINGSRVPIDLGVRLNGSTARLPLNLGVDGDVPTPPDPGVVGGLTSGASARWGTGSRVERITGVRWGGAVAAQARAAIRWGGARQVRHARHLLWGTPDQQRTRVEARWGQGADNVSRPLHSPWGSPLVIARNVGAPWGYGEARLGVPLQSLWRSPPQLSGVALALWRSGTESLRRSPLVHWSSPPPVPAHWQIPWGRGDGLEWIVRPLPPVPNPVPETNFPDGRYVGLNLACPVFRGSAQRLPLNLGITACWMARPKRRAYIVLNEISVVRLPDRLPIEVSSVSLTGGRDAWCWDGRLVLADPSQLSVLQPTVAGPRTVEITLNGYAWVIAIEGYDKAQVFGESDVSVTGRSVTAQLAEPYAQPRTRETAGLRTMEQLADAEVTGTDVTMDYGTVDWLVTAGAWYYQDMTPISALQRLAAASGGIVQSHPTDPVLEIRPRYPVSPWDWTTTTPDVVIQDDVVTGARLQLQSRPLFDAVIVAGEQVGVAARVRRAGEAGQTYAPQQIDQLITHADGARERGRNVLSERGGLASIEHDIPLFGGTLESGQPGLVLPLMLAQRVTGEGTWHGLVTAVRVGASRTGEAVDIVQTVTIERHYTDAD